MNKQLQDLRNILKNAKTEPESSEFFRNRGSKSKYIEMLQHKIDKLTQQEKVIPTFKQFFKEERVRLDPKCREGYRIGDPKTKTIGAGSEKRRVNNCVPVGEEAVSRVELSHEDKRRLLDRAWRMYQSNSDEDGKPFLDNSPVPVQIISALDRKIRPNRNLTPEEKRMRFDYLGSNEFQDKLDKIISGEDEHADQFHESDSSGEQIDLGYNLDAIEDLMSLFDQYGMRQGEHFVAHVGYGDDLPNAITIHNNTLRQLRPEQLEEIRATAQASHDEQVHEKNARCTRTTKKASSTSKGKKWMKCVKSDSGGYKRIHWGQKGVKVSGKANTKRRKSFRARHKCSTAKANTPRGQACKDW